MALPAAAMLTRKTCLVSYSHTWFKFTDNHRLHDSKHLLAIGAKSILLELVGNPPVAVAGKLKADSFNFAS